MYLNYSVGPFCRLGMVFLASQISAYCASLFFCQKPEYVPAELTGYDLWILVNQVCLASRSQYYTLLNDCVLLSEEGRQVSEVLKNFTYGVVLPEFKSWLHCLQVACSWTGYLTSLCFGILQNGDCNATDHVGCQDCKWKFVKCS